MSSEFKSVVTVSTVFHAANEAGETKELCDAMGMPNEIHVTKVSEPNGREETLSLVAVRSNVTYAKDVTYLVSKTDAGINTNIAQLIYRIDDGCVANTMPKEEARKVLSDIIIERVFHLMLKPSFHAPFHISKINISAAQFLMDTGVVKVTKDLLVKGVLAEAPDRGYQANIFAPYNAQSATEMERLYKVDKGVLKLVHTLVKANVDAYTRQTIKMPAEKHTDMADVNHPIYSGNGFWYTGDGVGSIQTNPGVIPGFNRFGQPIPRMDQVQGLNQMPMQPQHPFGQPNHMRPQADFAGFPTMVQNHGTTPHYQPMMANVALGETNTWVGRNAGEKDGVRPLEMTPLEDGNQADDRTIQTWIDELRFAINNWSGNDERIETLLTSLLENFADDAFINITLGKAGVNFDLHTKAVIVHDHLTVNRIGKQNLNITPSVTGGPGSVEQL